MKSPTLLQSRRSAIIEDDHDKIDSARRRAVLTSVLAAGLITSSGQFNGSPKDSISTRIMSTSSNVQDGTISPPGKDLNSLAEDSSGTGIIRRLDSLDDALEVIATSCDRRFLEAVVSTDYHFLYRGVDESKEVGPVIGIRREPSDLLDPSTYSSLDAAYYFSALEDAMKLRKAPIRPSNGHMAVTNADDAKSWGGSAVSIWPLVSLPRGVQSNNNSEETAAHFAWLENGGAFWPNDSVNNEPKSVLVDGVDCGRQALEDALKGDGWEVMFNSECFLTVPASMDRKLITKLKGAYLI